MTSFGAGLSVTRLHPWEPGLAWAVRAVVREALEHSHRLPPLGLVADVARLLTIYAPLPVETLDVDPTLRRLEDRVVQRLLAHPLRPRMVDAVAALPPEWRPRAIAVIAERLVDELEPEPVWWTPGEVRAWLALGDESVIRAAEEGWAEPAIREGILARCAALATRGTSGFTSADHHLLSFLPLLAQPSQRLAVHQLRMNVEALSRLLPRNVRARPRPGLIATHLGDEGAYPVGGFSALTTSGSLENLVRSELVYVDEGGDIDLFDVRWAEGELLYYTRDEAVVFRARRKMRIVFEPDLVAARVKDPDNPAQRLTMALALVVVACERLIDWLGDVDLCIELIVAPVLSEEAELLGLALRRALDAGIVWVRPAIPAGAGEAQTVSIGMYPVTDLEQGVVGLQEERTLRHWHQLGVALLEWLA